MEAGPGLRAALSAIEPEQLLQPALGSVVGEFPAGTLEGHASPAERLAQAVTATPDLELERHLGRAAIVGRDRLTDSTAHGVVLEQRHLQRVEDGRLALLVVASDHREPVRQTVEHDRPSSLRKLRISTRCSLICRP